MLRRGDGCVDGRLVDLLVEAISDLVAGLVFGAGGAAHYMVSVYVDALAAFAGWAVFFCPYWAVEFAT
eukprot:scaffold147268_cov30-Attheya_sp.AAC.1